MQQALHEGKNHVDVAEVLGNVGAAYRRLGKFRESLNYYQQALKMQQALHEGQNHAEVAEALRNVGIAYGRLGNYTQALEYYQQALTMQKALHEGENHADVAQVLRDVGDAYKGLKEHQLVCHVKALAARQEGDEQQAQTYLEKATASFEQALQASDAVEAGLYTAYGNFLLAIEKTAQAHGYLHQAIESGDDASGLSYSLLEQPTATPVLQAYISQQQKVKLRGIDYAYYLMIHHYADFQKAGIAMAQTKDAYLAAYKASIDQRSGQSGKTQEDKTAYHLLGSLYEAQGDQEAAATAFARSQDGTEQEDTQAAS